MAAPDRFVTIMIHTDGNAESRRFRMPLWVARIAAISLVVVAITILVATVLYIPLARRAALVSGLRERVANLEAENGQVVELAQRLEELEDRYTQMRTMLGANIVTGPLALGDTIPVAPAIRAALQVAGAGVETGLSVPAHWPLDQRGVVTRGLTGNAGSDEMHSGVDIAVPIGTPIRAAGGGIVRQAGYDPEYGLAVFVEHPDEYESLYGHASRLLVQVGDTVQAGQVIALTGSTGRSTAPHLHFEIRRRGLPVDPSSIIKKES